VPPAGHAGRYFVETMPGVAFADRPPRPVRRAEHRLRHQRHAQRMHRQIQPDQHAAYRDVEDLFGDAEDVLDQGRSCSSWLMITSCPATRSPATFACTALDSD
jgi:hypothetical protein